MEQAGPAYDHEAAARKLAKPIEDAANAGFVRGFVGKGKSFLPKGRLELPSKRFFDAAMTSLADGNADQREMDRRMAFAEGVQEILIRRQGELIEAYNRKVVLGRIADMAVGLLFLGLIVALIGFHGLNHWITISFLVIFAVNLFVMHFIGKKMANKAQAAFEGSSRDIEIPWAGMPSGVGDQASS